MAEQEFTTEEIAMIAANVPHKTIAREFGLHSSTISDVHRKKIWKHVD